MKPPSTNLSSPLPSAASWTFRAGDATTGSSTTVIERTWFAARAKAAIALGAHVDEVRCTVNPATGREGL